jgi:hypothetical protein
VEKTMTDASWTYLTAPANLWAKVEDNGVDKEVRVIAIGIHAAAAQPMPEDGGSNTVVLIAEPDNRWDRELQQHWHPLRQISRLYFRPRRVFRR